MSAAPQARRPAPRRRSPEEKAARLAERIAAEKAEVEARRPKVVVSDDVVIRDADVQVSRADPNAQRGAGETVRVRRAGPMPIEPPLPPMRAGEVRIDMAAYTARRLADEADRAMERQRRRQLDPCNLGLYGGWDD
ncbi:hypothetical protein [Bradyrhizobium sp. NBAIM01]|uniref:hypothetical protein n=1 Tax=Bradyrhizobium sp. NBAIM01 TaxID=2793818 RepID=UPI001CD59A5C|nr:hypothetical protein [Bradyrhizobium sp. NBAIM01]MCA1513641.1 hypothetical protein [Bradyrhizobium sp. NBAIM01]